MALKAAPAAKASGKLSPKAKAKPRAAAPAGATRRDRAHQPPGAATARSAMIPRPAPDPKPTRRAISFLREASRTEKAWPKTPQTSLKTHS